MASGPVRTPKQRLRIWVLCCSVVSGHLGGRVISSVGAQSQDRCVRISQLYQFSACFPFLNENVELLPVAKKREVTKTRVRADAPNMPQRTFGFIHRVGITAMKNVSGLIVIDRANLL